MKRLISLSALIICSFIISFGATQTWRLTNDSHGDTKPNIVIDNQHRVWIEWLSNSQGNYDVCCQKYDGGWMSREWLTNDGVDQISCDITCDQATGPVWAVWDSAGKVQHSEFSGGWAGGHNIVDSLFLFSQYVYNGRLLISVSGSGRKFLAWPAMDTTGYTSVFIMHHDSTEWSQPECVLRGEGLSMLYDYNHCPLALTVHQQKPVLLCYSTGWSMGGNWYTNLSANCSVTDTAWQYLDIASYQHSGGVYSGAPFKEAGIGFDNYGNLLTVFCDSIASGFGTLKCGKYSSADYQYLATYVIQANAKVHSGSVSQGVRPVAVWSDSQRIYASAFYDSMWSTIPTLISDSSLTNCINPDVAMENDSTMWVCYECDNEIYVTRTSVPLGVESNRPEPNKTSANPYIRTYPNPAASRVNVIFNNNGPAVISIYDITGGRIRSLTANNGRTVWDCRNDRGLQVSSGVYFIRSKQNNNEMINKINIVR